MKMVIIGLLGILMGCSSSQAKKDCEMTCLEQNCVVEKVIDNGCICKQKENPEHRVHGVY